MSSIIIKPIITEKVTDDTERFNRYGFIVDKRANKIQIKEAIEELYDVDVKDVNTMNYGGGKRKTKYTKTGIVFERNKAYKKAIVTVAEGGTIDLYGNI